MHETFLLHERCRTATTPAAAATLTKPGLDHQGWTTRAGPPGLDHQGCTTNAGPPKRPKNDGKTMKAHRGRAPDQLTGLKPSIYGVF